MDKGGIDFGFGDQPFPALKLWVGDEFTFTCECARDWQTLRVLGRWYKGDAFALNVEVVTFNADGGTAIYTKDVSYAVMGNLPKTGVPLMRVENVRVAVATSDQHETPVLYAVRVRRVPFPKNGNGTGEASGIVLLPYMLGSAAAE